MNSDMAFCPITGRLSIGVIGRDAKGNVLLLVWQFLRHCGSPKEAEATACLEGI
jgi:hypothetical protein